jgi:16S rRNA (cytosine1407-C5)-methyltransferase
MGLYAMQDAASMLPAELFSNSIQRPLILDLAAAPGGKTTHLISKACDRGLVIANDASHKRLPALAGALQAWGATSAVVTNERGERFGGWWPDTFDRVLLDAPCSGAELHLDDGGKGRAVSAHERQQLQRRQIGLLSSALRAAKIGGQIVYATCTLAPEENEAVLDALIREYGSAVEVVEVGGPIRHIAAAGINEFDGQSYDPQVGRALRLWPYVCRADASFVALIHKRDPIPGPRERIEGPRLADRGHSTYHEPQLAAALSDYGLDLASILADLDLTLWRRGDQVYAIPAPFVDRFDGLPFRSAGMLVGKWEDDGFTPSHEFASRFFERMPGLRFPLDQQQAATWLAGSDLRGLPLPDSLMGRAILLVDEMGRFVGRGKASAGRLRNLLPRRWFGSRG